MGYRYAVLYIKRENLIHLCLQHDMMLSVNANGGIKYVTNDLPVVSVYSCKFAKL